MLLAALQLPVKNPAPYNSYPDSQKHRAPEDPVQLPDMFRLARPAVFDRLHQSDRHHAKAASSFPALFPDSGYEF